MDCVPLWNETTSTKYENHAHKCGINHYIISKWANKLNKSIQYHIKLYMWLYNSKFVGRRLRSEFTWMEECHIVIKSVTILSWTFSICVKCTLHRLSCLKRRTELSWDLLILAATTLCAPGNNNYISSKVKKFTKTFISLLTVSKYDYLAQTLFRKCKSLFPSCALGSISSFLQIFKWFPFPSFSDFHHYQEIMMTSKRKCQTPANHYYWV